MNSAQADVLIIGAGPAGLAAAAEAAQRGKQVLLVDDNPGVGGQIWRDGPQAPHPRDAMRLEAMVAGTSNVSIMTGWRVVGVAGQRSLLLESARDSLAATFGTLVLCTGARELLLPFPGWTLPGVTGAGGLQALIKAGYDMHGQRLVVAGSGPLLVASADLAAHVGARVERIVEQAGRYPLTHFAAGLWRWPSKAAQGVLLASRAYRWGSHVAEALGDQRLDAVRIRDIRGRERTLRCDWLACGYGLVPNTELGALLGCAIRDGALVVDDRQATSRAGVFAAGECTGIGGKELALAEGRIAGCHAAGDASAARALSATRLHWQAFAQALARTFVLDDRLRHLARADTIVCRCEDVKLRDLQAEGGWASAKLVHRCGMGACQGRICGPATGFILGWQPGAPRPPSFPARVHTLADVPGDAA